VVRRGAPLLLHDGLPRRVLGDEVVERGPAERAVAQAYEPPPRVRVTLDLDEPRVGERRPREQVDVDAVDARARPRADRRAVRHGDGRLPPGLRDGRERRVVAVEELGAVVAAGDAPAGLAGRKSG